LGGGLAALLGRRFDQGQPVKSKVVPGAALKKPAGNYMVKSEIATPKKCQVLPN